MIGSWLCLSGIAHACEGKLPVVNEARCGFYLPEGKVCAEYWSLDDNAKYSAWKKFEQGLYQKYKFN